MPALLGPRRAPLRTVAPRAAVERSGGCRWGWGYEMRGGKVARGGGGEAMAEEENGRWR